MRKFIVYLFGVLIASAAASAEDWEYIPNQIYCELEQGYEIEEVNARWGTFTIHAESEENLYLLGIDAVEDLLVFIMAMNGDPAIDIADANWILEAPEGTRMMVIPAIGGTWGDYHDQQLSTRIGLDDAHETSTGAGVTIAVLDTGIDPDHEVFADNLSDYMFDCIDFDHEPWEEANGLDDDGDGLIDEGYGHGTMVAGLAALVAPDATIMPIRVLNDEGLGSLFGIAKGIMAAVSHGADIINASFGAPHPLVTIEQKLRVADQQGVITVAGAGNRDLEEPIFHPAADEHTFMVTALDSADIKADFADYHVEVMVSAPGVGVRSAYPGGEWGLGSGCSFATPLVAGEVALVLSVEPYTTCPEMALILRAAVDPIYHLGGNAPYQGRLGSGRIYLPGALGLSARVEDWHSAIPFTAWPNPARDAVHFRLDGGAKASATGLVIFDVEGRWVQSLRLSSDGLARWNVGPGLPNGLYYARTAGAVRSGVVPIVIMR